MSANLLEHDLFRNCFLTFQFNTMCILQYCVVLHNTCTTWLFVQSLFSTLKHELTRKQEQSLCWSSFYPGHLESSLAHSTFQQIFICWMNKICITFYLWQMRKKDLFNITQNICPGPQEIAWSEGGSSMSVGTPLTLLTAGYQAGALCFICCRPSANLIRLAALHILFP